jgi:SAM-dependent methyltransferase
LHLLFDHTLLRSRAQRHFKKRASNPFLEAIIADFSLRLAPIKRDFETASNLFPPDRGIAIALEKSKKILNLQTMSFDQVEDFETLSLGTNNFDLIISCLGLQFANDLPGVLAQLRKALKPCGLLLGCLMSGDTLKELRESFAHAEMERTGGITPHIHPAIDIRQMGALIQRAKFAEPIMDVEKFELHYADPMALLHDLRQWSMGNLLLERSRKFLTRAVLSRLFEIYREKFSTKTGKIKANFEIIWFSGWREERP